jgi:hypothetical protein
MFKHPFLKGRRPSKKKPLSFVFEDDTEPSSTVIEVDPNQVTLHDAIDEAIESATQASEAIAEAQDAIVDILGPTEFETPEETLLKEAQKPEWKAENEDGEEIELDEESQDALNDAFITMVNKDGKTLKETFDEELEEDEDDTFEL